MLNLICTLAQDRGAGGVAAFLPCCCFSVGGLVGLAMMGFWIWMLVEVVTKEPAEEQSKVMWVLIVALLGGLGAAIYFFARRGERKRKYGK